MIKYLPGNFLVQHAFSFTYVKSYSIIHLNCVDNHAAISKKP